VPTPDPPQLHPSPRPDLTNVVFLRNRSPAGNHSTAGPSTYPSRCSAASGLPFDLRGQMWATWIFGSPAIRRLCSRSAG